MRPEQALQLFRDIADTGSLGETPATIALQTQMMREAADVLEAIVAAYDAAVEPMRDAAVLAKEAHDRLVAPLTAYDEADQ